MQPTPVTPPRPAGRASTGLRLVLTLFIALFTVFLYTFLHEAGHALVGLLFGQTLTAFNLNFWDFSAHVGLSGELTASQNALRSAAGAGLPLLAWLVFISLTPRQVNFSFGLFRLFASVTVLGSLLAWIILPLFRLFGNAFASDDVTHYLRYSQMPPLLLSILAIVLVAMGWSLFVSKAGSPRDQILLIREAGRATLLAGAGKTLPALVGLLAVCLLVTLAASGVAAKNEALALAPPAGFQPLETVDLAQRDYPAVTLAEFSLTETTTVGVFFRVENLDTSFIELRLEGGEEGGVVLLHGEAFRADRNTGLWQEPLPAGDYRLVLDARQSPGTLAVYMGYP